MTQHGNHKSDDDVRLWRNALTTEVVEGMKKASPKFVPREWMLVEVIASCRRTLVPLIACLCIRHTPKLKRATTRWCMSFRTALVAVIVDSSVCLQALSNRSFSADRTMSSHLRVVGSTGSDLQAWQRPRSLPESTLFAVASLVWFTSTL
eukprot:5430804-Amphidinium_carterae.1